MRLFIAIDLPEDVKKYLLGLKKELHGLKCARFVTEENMHLTLKFLGEVPDKYVESIAEALKRIQFEPFKVKINKLGVFPNDNHIRVLWVNVLPETQILDVKKQADSMLPGYKDDFKFKNHITIARIDFPTIEEKEKIKKIIQNKVDEKEFLIEKIKLYKSTLTSRWPEYEAIG
jgi:2'-5' RNA ligase